MKSLKLLTICAFVVLSCSKTDKENIDTDKDKTMYFKEDENVDPATREATNWDEVDVTSPIVKYEEIESEEIEVRGTETYSVYGVDEAVLFDFDKAQIRDTGKEKLKEVINSVQKRHPDGEIAVRGYTDAVGSKDYNKELSEDRAKAVADYMKENSDIEDSQISVLAKGEKNPVATNETAQGRQQNRRVEILVKNK